MTTLLVTICYCLIAPVLVLFEEVFLAISNFKTIRSVNAINKQWDDMDETDQTKFIEYYRFLEYGNERRLQVMAREASIQLVLQNGFALYQFAYPPLRELDYSSKLGMGDNGTRAYTLWIIGLIIQLVSILLSANSTFSTILKDIQFQKFKKEQKHVSITSYITTIFQVLLHIIFASGIVYLLQVTNLNS